MAESETRVSRETRLLILVIGVAVVVLFVLAQVRFPEAEVRLSTVTPAGLDRLAAKSNYDDLASAVNTAMQGVEASVVVFEAIGVPDGSKQEEHRRIQAIRLRDGLAIAALPGGFKSMRSAEGEEVPLLRLFEPARGVAIAALMSPNVPAKSASIVTEFPGFAYIAAVEPAAGGPTATPMFIGRVDPLYDERWEGELLVPGGSASPPAGSFVFLLDGRFIGLVVKMPSGVHAIAPAVLLTRWLDSKGGPAAEGSR